MSSERKHKRIRLTRKLPPIAAAFKTENVRGEGHIGSLSREGMFIATETLPAEGDFVTIIFPDRSGSKIEVCGTVRWTTAEVGQENCPKPGFGMHLEFLTDEYQEFYEELLTS